jgi:hypothetical protein
LVQGVLPYTIPDARFCRMLQAWKNLITHNIKTLQKPLCWSKNHTPTRVSFAQLVRNHPR